MIGFAGHRTSLTTLNAITATLRASRTATGGQGGASRLVGGTGLSCGPGGPHGATLRVSPPLRVSIPMPTPGVLRAGDGRWFALPGSLARPLRRRALRHAIDARARSDPA